MTGNRVKRLYGLRFEALEKTAEALENYDNLTEEDGTDTVLISLWCGTTELQLSFL
jgi:hypothetical protein